MSTTLDIIYLEPEEGLPLFIVEGDDGDIQVALYPAGYRFVTDEHPGEGDAVALLVAYGDNGDKGFIGKWVR